MNSEYEWLLQIHRVAAACIFLWAGFCVFCDVVKDGVIGRVLFTLLALAAFAVVLTPYLPASHAIRATVMMNCLVAAVGFRHAWMKLIWPYISCWYIGYRDQSEPPRRRASDNPLGGR